MSITTSIYPERTAARVLEIALAEVGTVEGPKDNETKYGKFMKADLLPWCGSFVNWVMSQAGVKIPSVVSTAKGAHIFQETNRWSTIPHIGALAFMDFPGDGIDRISHVGIVIDFKHGKDEVTCIEGNTSGTGDQRNGGMVMIKTRSLSKQIVGFGVPKYVPYTGPVPTVPVTKKKRAKKWNKPKV
jgi:hypothetical protein